MAGAFQFTLTGDKALDRFFRTFPAKVQKKVVRKPLRDGAKIVNDAAKSDAPVRSGKLRKAYRVRAAKRSRKNKHLVTIRPQIGAGDFKGETFYGAFGEFGHRVGPRRLGNARAIVPGLHTFERAFKRVSSQAQSVTVEGIKRGIEAEARLASH